MLYQATDKDFSDARAQYGFLNKRFDAVAMSGKMEPDDRREVDDWLKLAEATITKIETGELEINYTYDIEESNKRAKVILDKYVGQEIQLPKEMVESGRIKRTTKDYIRMKNSEDPSRRLNDPSSLLPGN